jgi:SAM-dependent methyltransferase
MAVAASDADPADAARLLGDLIERLAAGRGGAAEAAVMARLMTCRSVEPALLVAAALRRAFALPGFDVQPLMRTAAAVLQTEPEWAPLLAAPAPRDLAAACVAGDAPVLADPLFAAMLTRAICTSAPMERMLLAMRRSLLLRAGALSPRQATLALLLARQAAHNGYAWPEDIHETALVDAQLRALLATPATPSSAEALLRAAMYRPPADILPGTRQRREFARFDAARALMALLPDPAELAARRTIPSLVAAKAPPAQGAGSGSRHAPGARWLDIAPPWPGEHRARLRRHVPPDEAARFDGPLDMLFAACGTGRAAITLALDHGPSSRLLAIDPDIADLAYAQRQATRLGCTSIGFVQAGLGDLARLALDFDVIEAGEALHRLADPLPGWRELAGRLKPGGLMRVALHGPRVPRDVAAARAEVARLGLPPTLDGIRRLRRMVIEAPDDAADWRIALRRFAGIFTTCGTRDLVFDSRERGFPPDRIAASLTALGLDFAGAELPPSTLDAYRRRFPEDPQARDLARLARFDADNSEAFAGMITFWCRRPGSAPRAGLTPP